MSEHLLDIKNLSVYYTSGEEVVRAVNDISFTLDKGKVIGLVGETGAGKTTTALSILRLLPERTGYIKEGSSIKINDEELLDLPEIAMRDRFRGKTISMIFQDPMTSLNPVMRVGDQIAEALVFHNEAGLSSAEIDAKVNQTLELVGIPKERKIENPHQFSGGMKQRVVIAIALACEPELLIADEPTTALDVTIQAQVLAMMDELKDKLGTSMILITHDLGIVAQMCDDVAVMYAGELVEKGTLEDIFSGDKHHPYTVGLFGSIPNLNVETERLTPIDGLLPDPTALPEGCFFYPRCPHRKPECEKNHPAEIHEGTHMLRCHLFAGKE